MPIYGAGLHIEDFLCARKSCERATLSQEAVSLDSKFALAWALLSNVDATGYITAFLQPTIALREEARQAAETALTLQPNLGEAILAKGRFHYACLKDYDTAARYVEHARQFLPNSSHVPELLAYVARRRGQWDQSELFFNEAERLDPRNPSLLAEHAFSQIHRRRFAEAQRTLDQILDIAPDDLDTLATEGAIAQAEGDLPRASTILAPLHPAANNAIVIERQTYQAILERHAENNYSQTQRNPSPTGSDLRLLQRRTSLLARLGAGCCGRPCCCSEKLATSPQRVGTSTQGAAGESFSHWRSCADRYGLAG